MHQSLTAGGDQVSRRASRRAQTVCYWLLPLALVYCFGSIALSRAIWLVSFRHGNLLVGSMADVFAGGAVPGVLVTLLLGLSRPDVFVRPLRQGMVVVSLLGAGVVATLPVTIAWLTR